MENAKILVVDDRPSSIKLLRARLAVEGYGILEAQNGIEALEAIRAQGIKTPIVFCTDEAEKKSVESAMGSGATDYIIKPYTPTLFRSTIMKALGRE